MSPRKKTADDDFSILSSVCQHNVSLDVRPMGEKSTEFYRSSFLAFQRDAIPPVLVIQAPTSKGRIILLRPGQKIKLVFVHNGVIYSCATAILGRVRHQLNREIDVAALQLQVPAALATGKIRSFYRLSIPRSRSLEVMVGIYTGKRGKQQRIRSREKAYMTDIGGGGMGFRIAEGRSLLLGVDTRLSLSFRLSEEDQPIRLLGKIGFYLRRRDVREVFFGVQFIEVDSDIAYKRNIDKILRYVAEQQRISLQSRLNAIQ
ncbi:MAG: flagellar brake protein [Candidatus Abyssobacteria bacterium SURF_5]|uniref:Flagellar brake protein n=1 Tax=Abyssobacteria bacterium (strain SURF_5) TaxID=2093360 RepID=A0A3A4NQE9_ABYX5|nr:MAG: flagellar brake protein [Candidatus Abyssubacteria bacterium SURF_5]